MNTSLVLIGVLMVLGGVGILYLGFKRWGFKGCLRKLLEYEENPFKQKITRLADWMPFFFFCWLMLMVWGIFLIINAIAGS